MPLLFDSMCACWVVYQPVEYWLGAVPKGDLPTLHPRGAIVLTEQPNANREASQQTNWAI